MAEDTRGRQRPPSTVHQELEPSAGHQRKGCYRTEVRIERARLPRRPPSAACEPSRWNLVRDAVRLRSIAFYWLGETVATLCAPDGRYSLEDLEAFLRDLEECEGESAC